MKQVKRFDPRLGPWEGGTNVTIEGVNLGKTFSDIDGGITVAGMPCHPYKDLYVQTRRIVCLVDSPKSSEPRRGSVIVRVSNFKGESAEQYEFVNPVIESIHPSRGPVSGGTLLTIHGKFMNAGSSIQAVIDPSLPCTITFTNASHAICRTTASNRFRSGELQMTFDRGVRRFTKQMFQYVEDPTIEYAESGIVSQVKVPKGIPSGGILVTVVGNNMEYIQVKLYFPITSLKRRLYLFFLFKGTENVCSLPRCHAHEQLPGAQQPTHGVPISFGSSARPADIARRATVPRLRLSNGRRTFGA